MEDTTLIETYPPCNIDIKRPEKSHISAWRDKSEFQKVYDQIFLSPLDDFDSKESGVKWLNVWKLRQNRETPICIRCTLVILEAQLFDLRGQREGRENTTETKSIYAGAFTRFINFITEEKQNFRWKKTTIAQHVREIGIETYLVELRHLCAHRSISVSIDVFRRSAQYCMDWLKVSYWERELSSMQPVTIFTIRSEKLSAKLPELTSILRTYDAATAGLAQRVTTVEQVESFLTSEELALLQKCASHKLKAIAAQMVRQLRESLSLPRSSIGLSAICNGLFVNCRHLFLDPLNKDAVKQKPAPLGEIHGELFRYLASTGCLQEFFERLMTVCENESENDEQRLVAKYWALQIAMSFQLLRQFKKACKSLPPERLVRFHETSKKATALAQEVTQEWLKRTLRVEARQQLLLGMTVDCPWHLKLSRAYLQNRLTAVNQYTKDIIPVLLSLVQPPLKVSQQKQIEQLMSIYVTQEIPTTFNSDVASNEITPKKGARARQANEDDGSTKIYTAEHIVKAMGTKRSAEDAVECGNGSKNFKRSGPWSASTATIDWECCPLGTYHVSLEEKYSS